MYWGILFGQFALGWLGPFCRGRGRSSEFQALLLRQKRTDFSFAHYDNLRLVFWLSLKIPWLVRLEAHVHGCVFANCNGWLKG